MCGLQPYKAYLNENKPHFKCPVAVCGYDLHFGKKKTCLNQLKLKCLQDIFF